MEKKHHMIEMKKWDREELPVAGVKRMPEACEILKFGWKVSYSRWSGKNYIKTNNFEATVFEDRFSDRAYVNCPQQQRKKNQINNIPLSNTHNPFSTLPILSFSKLAIYKLSHEPKLGPKSADFK